jgi:hypothetical protein
MHAYLFEVMYDEDGPSVKYGMDMSGCVSEEYAEALKTAAVAAKAAKRLGSYVPKRKFLDPIIKLDGLEEKLAMARLFFMRSQITGIPLYLIKTEEEMTFEDIEQFLRAMNKPGELRAFLEKAKV